MIKNLTIVIQFLIVSLTMAQKGPGGVGTTDGTSSLVIWYNTSSGVKNTGSLIDSIINSAGISALDIAETGAQRPILVTAAVNGFDEISFSGSNRLRTGVNLTTSNFVTTSASTFLVSRADNTTQTTSVYTTDPLVASTRFSNHVPWNGTVYYDFGSCCNATSRLQVDGLSGLTDYSFWTLDAAPLTGRQMYRNGSLLQSRAGISAYSNHATHRFNIGANTNGSNGFQGDVTEVIIFRAKINTAQRIIIENYLAAKYGLISDDNDYYTQDNPLNGNFDFDVAGIGRADAANLHSEAQGTGIVRVSNPTGLGDNEYLLWGHDNEDASAYNSLDVAPSLEGRLTRVWRVNEVNSAGSAVDVGAIDISFDLTDVAPVDLADLGLLIDRDNDGFFNDETPIIGATSLGGDVIGFLGVQDIENGLRFTLSKNAAPLPVNLTTFVVKNIDDQQVEIYWQTASETDNDYFVIEKSSHTKNWNILGQIGGAGNSSRPINYTTIDKFPYPGVSYYRLKQVDFNGQYEYSSIKAIQTHAQNGLRIHPNPATHEMTIEGNQDDLSDLSIYNHLGQDVTEQTHITPVGNGLKIDISLLTNGSYTIKTRNTSSILFKQ